MLATPQLRASAASSSQAHGYGSSASITAAGRSLATAATYDPMARYWENPLEAGAWPSQSRLRCGPTDNDLGTPAWRSRRPRSGNLPRAGRVLHGLHPCTARIARTPNSGATRAINFLGTRAMSSAMPRAMPGCPNPPPLPPARSCRAPRPATTQPRDQSSRPRESCRAGFSRADTSPWRCERWQTPAPARRTDGSTRARGRLGRVPRPRPRRIRLRLSLA
jgi:hypothetical protein